MIFITGPMYSGKKTYIRKALHMSQDTFSKHAVWDVQDMAGQEDPALLADRLSRYDVVIATETGCGIIPADAEERMKREEAGRLACALAARADVVIRVCCGLPQVLKGNWPV